MEKHAGSFDFILDCVAAEHDINAYINLLARDGNLTMVGAPEKPLPVAVFGLIFGRRSFSGSPIGGIAETQEMLDFCGEHNITADVEVIPIQKINEAYERMVEVRREVPLLDRHGVASSRRESREVADANSREPDRHPPRRTGRPPRARPARRAPGQDASRTRCGALHPREPTHRAGVCLVARLAAGKRAGGHPRGGTER